MLKGYECQSSSVNRDVLWIMARHQQRLLGSGLENVAKRILERDYGLTYSSTAKHLLNCVDCREQYYLEIKEIRYK